MSSRTTVRHDQGAHLRLFCFLPKKTLTAALVMEMTLLFKSVKMPNDPLGPCSSWEIICIIYRMYISFRKVMRKMQFCTGYN